VGVAGSGGADIIGIIVINGTVDRTRKPKKLLSVEIRAYHAFDSLQITTTALLRAQTTR
jgi:hypothetical protein